MAPKRAFGGVLRPFGGGFRGPNRERASVFSGAGRGRAGGSAVEPGRDQRVQRRGTGRCRWFCGGARRRSQRVQRRGIGAGRGVQRCRRDGPAAGSQKKCSEGKMRPPPGRKKSVPRGRCAAARTHTGTKKTDLGPFTSISATLRASAPGCSSDTPCRTTTAPHSGSPSLLRETSGSMFSCNSLSAFDFGLPVGRGHSRESLRHPEPQPLSRPPVGAQPPGRRNLSRPGSPP